MAKKQFKKVPMGSKAGKGGVSLPGMKSKKGGSNINAVSKEGGPHNAYGFTSINSNAKRKNISESENFSLGVQKDGTSALNNIMKQKSAFDTFYEQVMEKPGDLGAGPDSPTDDLESLDLDPSLSDDSEGGEDEITISIPRELAKLLHAALASQVEAGDELSDEELGADEFGADDSFGDESDVDDSLGENVKSEPAPKAISKSAGKSLMGKGSMKAPSNLKPGGKATDKAKLDVVAEPKKLSNTGKELQGKDNKVNASKMPKPGSNMFD